MARNSKRGFGDSFIPRKGDSKEELARKIVTIVFAVILAAALSVLGGYFARIAKNKREKDERLEQFTQISVITPATTAPPDESEEIVTEPPPLVMLENFESFMAENPDTAGWINVPNTKINDVVVQTSDNEFYLDKNFYGSRSQAGHLYIDFRCVINDYDDNQSDNVVIYGHNQADGSMFGTLKKYKIKKDNTKNFSFYQENPTFTFTSLYNEYTYKIIAMFVIEVEPFQTRDGIIFDYHNYVRFGGDRNFDRFSENVLARTAVNTGVDFEKGDKFMTLSTCSNEFEPSRFVVIGRRVRNGESPEVDTSLSEINEDMLEPDYSYIYSR